MLSIRNKRSMISVFAILAMMLSFANVSPAAAQLATPPEPPGWTQGTGTHFALPNSPYLPVTLNSSASVTLVLSSVPDTVDLLIVPDAAAGSAQFTLGGFAANTRYYHYVDNGLDPIIFATDATGSFTFTQDLSEPHHVWFRSQPSTLYLYDNATGGDCSTSMGTWSPSTKTCTLTHNVNTTIFIESSGITLDGAGYQVSVDRYYAVYASDLSNVTIKNLNAISSCGIFTCSSGIWALYITNLTVTNNIVSGGSYGIYTFDDTNVSVTNNTVVNTSFSGISNYYGIANVTIEQNTVSTSSRGFSGIYVYGFPTVAISDVAVTNNRISGFDYGIYAQWPHNLTVTKNTISNSSSYGLYLYDPRNDGSPSVYNNNFINNLTQIYNSSGNGSFNQAAPIGGNYFSDFNTPAQGCSNANGDSFCDTPYYFYGGQDNLPWTAQDGWLNSPPTVNAGGPYSGDEGSAIAMSGATASDPDASDTLTYAWSVDSALCSFDDANALNPSLTCGDNGSYTATLSVSDGVNPTVASIASVVVNNVAPSVSLRAANAAICDQRNFMKILFDDPAYANDTYTANVHWGDGSIDTYNSIFSGFAVSHAYSLAGQYTATVTVSDEDGGTSAISSAVLSHYLNTFVGGGVQQPINQDGSSVFKFKSTIPVKVQVQDCNGSFVSNLTLKIALTQLSGNDPGSPINEPISTSAADTTGFLRFTGSPDYQYIYNLASKSLPDSSATYEITLTIMQTGQTVTADFGLKP